MALRARRIGPSQHVEGLPGRGCAQRAQLPSVRQPVGRMGGAGDLVGQERGESLPGIEIAIAIIGGNVEAVVGYSLAVFGHFVESMCPSISDLSAQSMPSPDLKRCLQSVVVGSTLAIHLQDGSKIRILCVVSPILVDIRPDR